MGIEHGSFTFKGNSDAQATIDAYADVPLLLGGGNDAVVENQFIAQSSGPLAANWKNTGAQSIHSRVLGSNDKSLADGDWEVVVAEAVILAAASRHVSVNPCTHHFYKFQHRAAVGGAQGATQLRATHKRI